MIQTGLGPVPLRAQRAPQKIKLHVQQGQPQEKAIKKGWLSNQKELYTSAVMQSMLVAATQMELADLGGRVAKDPDTGKEWTADKAKKREMLLKQKLQRMLDGTAQVPQRRAATTHIRQGLKFLKKYRVVKRCARTSFKKVRWFSIDSGKLKVFKSAKPIAQVTHLYDLSDAESYRVETTAMPTAEPFYPGFSHRVKLSLRERPHGPLYLYADDAMTAQSWERAIKMSKYLKSPSDKEALSSVVGKLAGSIMNKGWQALFIYAKEIQETRANVKKLAQRLLRVDLARGWTKARVVYLQKQQGDRLRNDQQEMAAKFLKEKLDRINTQAVRTPKMVRASIIHQLQTKFRHYRQEKIFDRIYPLGSSVITRVQQAQTGTTMGAAFKSVTRDDTLFLVLNNESHTVSQRNPDLFKGKSSTYSEVNVDVCHLGVNVSESHSMLSFAEQDEDPEMAHLAKEGWAHFVNLDQISSVILHSERMLLKKKKGGKSELHSSMTQGVWFTINGPRICWCRGVRTFMNPQTKSPIKRSVGANSGFEGGIALARGEPVRWFKVGVRVNSAYVPYLREPLDEGEETFHTESGAGTRPQETRQTFMILYLLGRTFMSQPMVGESPTYPGRFEADVPISKDDDALDFLDECEVGVDIVEKGATADDQRTIFAGTMPLWNIFAPEPVQAGPDGQRMVEEVVSLSQSLRSGTGRRVKPMALSAPSDIIIDKVAPVGRVDLEVIAHVQEMPDPSRCISPELQGRGPIAALFTAHRGAWYDPKLGESRFHTGRVANFIELKIRDLNFPESDIVDSSKLYRYQIVAKCRGIASCTMSLHRAKESWKQVVPVNPRRIDFEGCALYLPLPPGAWCVADVRPHIEIQVMRCPQGEEKTRTYNDLIAQDRSQGPALPIFERVYHAVVLLDGMIVDEVKAEAPIMLSRSTSPEARFNLGTLDTTGTVDHPAILKVDAALRDRDFVLMHAAEAARSDGLGRGFVLCVGDRATIRVEEPIKYPKSEQEFRRRFFPGTYDEQAPHRGLATGGAWVAPLREPSMSHEYSESGLGELKDVPPFRQRFVPMNCDDIVPYKYVLPGSEIEFLRKAKAGVFWRIVESIAEKKLGQAAAPLGRTPLPRVIVEELSHLIRHVPCTVLAVYADETCDVEVSEAFMAQWENNKDRHYTMPGWVVIERFKDESRAAMRSAPAGTGDVSQRLRMRVILKGIPLNMVDSQQQASFNIYDARFGSVDEAAKEQPRDLGNDFNPRVPQEFEDQATTTKRRGGYSIHPGPVPTDVGPMCLYEWSLHLQARNVDEMYLFITALRQSVRMNVHMQLRSLREWKNRSALAANALPYQMGVVHTTSSGHMEVVLVEAKHMIPPQVMRFPDTVTAMKKNMQRPPATMASFQVMQDGKPLIYRGSKVQFAPAVVGESPQWSEVDELKSSGGWVFKTPPMDPVMQEKLQIEVDLLTTFKQPVGRFRIEDLTNFTGDDASQAPINLCDAEHPFHDLWVRLDQSNQKDDAITKVHIMTMWVPQQQSVKSKHLPKKAIDWRKYLLQGRMSAPTVREYINQEVDIEVQKRGYNPNLWFGENEWPLTRSAAIGVHIQEHASATPYLKCCEAWERRNYIAFRKKLKDLAPRPEEPNPDDGHTAVEERDLELWEWRDNWSERRSPEDEPILFQLEAMVRNGIAPDLRNDVWRYVSLANITLQEYKQASPAFDFNTLVKEGQSLKNEALAQLSEDMVEASAWENAMMPEVMEKHMQRITAAHKVCVALIVFSQDDSGLCSYSSVTIHERPRAAAIAYCESLLALAFHMLIAVGQEHKGTKTLTPTGLSDEETVFWLLYTIAGSPHNAAYSEYYCTTPNNTLAERRGAMEDVNRLSSILARHERDLWVHLSGIGFHLSMVFYGAFMRLFATYLPTQSCYRFWDLILVESVPRQGRDPTKIPRHSLIDLAFAVLQKCKDKLLQCQSAFDAKCAILDCFEHLYDPSEVLRMAAAAEYLLWDTAAKQASEAVGIPCHTKDYERACFLWEQFIRQFYIQNLALRDLIRDRKLDKTMNTKSLGLVVRKIRDMFQQEDSERGTYIGMHRVVPVRIRKLGPELDQSFFGTITSWFGRMTESVMMENLALPVAFSIPRLVEFAPGPHGEPTHMDAADFERQVGRVVGTDWGPHFHKIYQAFMSPNERRLSANEFFISALCCSKGTVGEKAMELFKLFATVQPPHRLAHIIPTTHAAHTVVDKIDFTAKQAEGLVFKCPRDENFKNHALHFKVFTHKTGSQEILFGEAFVPTLRPYLWSGAEREISIDHLIFGIERRLPPGIELTSGNHTALLNDIGVRPDIGVMHMAIKWMPASESKLEEGQLGIRLKYIEFSNKYVEAQQFKNPRVEVYTYNDAGQPVKIKRWDPRGMLRKGGSLVTDGMAYGGAFGDYIEFEETERRLPNGSLMKKRGVGEGHGFYDVSAAGATEKKGRWMWSKKYGDQFSMERMRMKNEFVKFADARPNAIALRACRMITRVLLSRSLHCVTNRMALNIADQAFNRVGAVPAILDALLVRGDVMRSDISTAAQLKEALQNAGASFLDIKHQVILCHEDTIDRCPGDISLFPQLPGAAFYNLASMEIQDPYPGIAKVLWIRYARAGDGQRFNAAIQVGPDGGFLPQNLSLDMEVETELTGKSSGRIQMSLSKVEFVSCLMNSPILSESMRQLSSANSDPASATRETRCIKLDVIMADPNHNQADEDFLDALNVRQAVCFELWDYDVASKDDFLGECWLPPFSELTEEPKQFVLEVRNAPEHGAVTESRPHPQKKGLEPGTCKGNLFIRASWKFPADTVDDITDEDDLQTRVKKEVALHTGTLHVEIIKATDLRSADVRRQSGSDPYVIAYVRNETLAENKSEKIPGIGEGGWRTDPKTGFHLPLFKTTVKYKTVSPEWNEKFDNPLKTGAFERRTNRSQWARVAGGLDVTGRTAQHNADDHALDVLHGRQDGSGLERGKSSDIRLFFGIGEIRSLDMVAVPNRTDGYRHDVKVLFSDSIHSFKGKVKEACQQEADKTTDNSDAGRKRKAAYDALAKGINFRYVVLVFEPSQRLRELMQHQSSNREYRRLYRLEYQDPNSWVPLDTVRDFESYKNKYGFKVEDPQQLRIVEGTEDYKHKNSRYRTFVEEQRAWRSRIEWLNTESECFGYAKYKHPGDGDSAEWRPAILERPEQHPGELAMRYQTHFLHSPSPMISSVATGSQMPGQVAKESLHEGEVLLAPRVPKINNSDRLEHIELLAKVAELREKNLSDKEITDRLNKEMKAKYNQQHDYGYVENSGGFQPLTLVEVQQEIKRIHELEALGKNPGQATNTTSPGSGRGGYSAGAGLGFGGDGPSTSSSAGFGYSHGSATSANPGYGAAAGPGAGYTAGPGAGVGYAAGPGVGAGYAMGPGAGAGYAAGPGPRPGYADSPSAGASYAARPGAGAGHTAPPGGGVAYGGGVGGAYGGSAGGVGYGSSQPPGFAGAPGAPRDASANVDGAGARR